VERLTLVGDLQGGWVELSLRKGEGKRSEKGEHQRGGVSPDGVLETARM